MLADADALAEKVRAFDRKKRTISLGMCAPAPIWLLTPHISSLYPSMRLQTEIAEEDALRSGLETSAYQLIVLSQKPEDDKLFAKACGQEHLLFALPKGHRYARRKSLTFREMNGRICC